MIPLLPRIAGDARDRVGPERQSPRALLGGPVTPSVRPLLLAATAAAGFAWLVLDFRCCEGEDGFGRNVAVLTAVAVAVLIAAIVACPPRPLTLFRGLATLTAWLLSLGCILIARPPWDRFVASASLDVEWRTAAVFVTTAFVAVVARRAASRQT